MVCRAVRWVGKRLGRRGVVLALLGTGKVCYGLGYILAPSSDLRGLELLTRWAPLRWWALVWVVCGVVTFSSAWLRIGRDKYGFIAALVPPFVWGSAFLWGAVIGDYARGLAVFGWYATSHVGVILWASAVPEYELPHPVRRERT